MNTAIKIFPSSSPTARREIGPILNSLLADEYALSLAARRCCWNATGPDALRIRSLLESQIRESDRRLDRLAWQIGTVGACARLDLAGLAAAGDLAFVSGARPGAQALLNGLADLHDEMIVRLKSAVGMVTDRIGDAGTAILLTDLLMLRERDVWMLRALRWDLAASHVADTWMPPATPWDHRVAAVA